MKLVVSGYIGHGNIGDEWVLAGLLRTLRQVAPDVSVVAISADPAQTRRAHGVDAVRRTDAIGIGRALRGADGLISGGGSLLQDATSARPVAYYAGVMLLARALRRPYVIHAQGLGPIRRGPNRRLAATALRAAAAVSLRDPESIAMARALGIGRHIDLVPDPALALTPRVTPGGDGAIVAAVRDWRSARPYLPAIRAALDQVRDLGPIVALPMHGSVDVGASQAVVKGIADAEVLGSDLSHEEAADVIGAARLVVGMRLHALILAAGADVPAVAISYDPKVDAFAAQVGQPVAGHVDEPIDPEALAGAIRAALSASRTMTRQRVAALRADLGRAAQTSVRAIAEWRG